MKDRTLSTQWQEARDEDCEDRNYFDFLMIVAMLMTLFSGSTARPRPGF